MLSTVTLLCSPSPEYFPSIYTERHRRAWRSYPTLKVRNGGSKEIPLVQDKEQRLCFAGAAVERYPTSKVRETQVRW